MPRRQVKRGGRKFQPEKPLIYVFCEGESEQAYAKFLKEHFADVAVLKIPSKTGLFSKAKNDFDKEPKYRNYAEVTDEIWFFFDVEAELYRLEYHRGSWILAETFPLTTCKTTDRAGIHGNSGNKIARK